MSRLLIVAADRISDWIEKGEVVDRYFNPGEVFDEVHLLLLAPADRPPASEVKRMVGTANFEIHSAPVPSRPLLRTIGWRPPLVERLVREAVDVAEAVAPDVVRCHGADINAIVARQLKFRRGTPYAVSLHVPRDDLLNSGSRRLRIGTKLAQDMSRRALLDADLVLPVYQSIEPELRALGIERYEVAYNMANPTALRAKEDYSLNEPPQLISVGRQFESKNPSQVIRAMRMVPDAELTLIGDGPLHSSLIDVATDAGVEDRVHFRRAVPNDELCSNLGNYDVFITHSEYSEISKALLEAFLSGLPVIINRRHGAAVPELSDDICLLVHNNPQDYAKSLLSLLSDTAARMRLGKTANSVANERWAPDVTEERFAMLYRSLLTLSENSA